MQNLNVNITPDNYPQSLYYSQNDVGREFKINITDFTIPVGATVKIQATKPSGFGFSVAGTVSGNSVTFETTDEMTDEAGRFPAELVIESGAVVIGTANFLMVGEMNPHPEGTTDGSQGTIIPELTLLVERVEAAASSVLDMQVVAQTLPAGSQASYSYDEDLNKATFGIPEGQAGAGAAGVVASAYSAAKTYKVGDYVLYNSNLYRCTTAITTAEAWTAAHWTQIVLADDVSDLKSDLSKVILPPANLVKLSMVEENKTVSTTSVGATVGTASSSNYDLAEAIPVNANVSYKSYNARLWLVTDASGKILEVDDTNHESASFTITPTYNGYLYVVFFNTQRERYYVNTNGETKYISPTDYPAQEWLLDVLENYTKDTFERVDTMIRDSYNLVKSSEITQGKAMMGNESIGKKYQLYDNATYDTVIGVPAIAGQEYYVESSRLFYVVDEFGYLLERDTTNRSDVYTYTPTHDGFFAVSYIAEYHRGKFFINKKEDGSSFEGYDEKYPMPWLTNLLGAPTLKGKTIYNFGDSVSQGGHQTYGPAEIVANECGMICNDYAVGGASMVNYADVQGAEARSCIVTQIQNAPSTAPDFILLAGGINDLKFTTAGTAPSEATSYLEYNEAYINNLDITKFSGAFEKAIYTLIAKYPTSQLIYMFEQRMFDHHTDGTPELHEVAMDICKKWGIPVLDMWDYGGLNLAIIPQLVLYGSVVEDGGFVVDGVHYDGTHPNDLGYKKFYAPKLKAKLIECCQTITD